MTQEQYALAERLCEEATPGPCSVITGIGTRATKICALSGVHVREADLFAAAPVLMPAMLAEIKRLRAEVAEARSRAVHLEQSILSEEAPHWKTCNHFLAGGYCNCWVAYALVGERDKEYDCGALIVAADELGHPERKKDRMYGVGGRFDDKIRSAE